ncbi:hypothetical protein K438DRAFT_1949835 [Mycena galopus ATCC 62051]|nr:hypothetical protein K438DRAFT_1949835 [Mycena galopus ATCC 62051]
MPSVKIAIRKSKKESVAVAKIPNERIDFLARPESCAFSRAADNSLRAHFEYERARWGWEGAVLEAVESGINQSTTTDSVEPRESPLHGCVDKMAKARVQALTCANGVRSGGGVYVYRRYCLFELRRFVNPTTQLGTFISYRPTYLLEETWELFELRRSVLYLCLFELRRLGPVPFAGGSCDTFSLSETAAYWLNLESAARPSPSPSPDLRESPCHLNVRSGVIYLTCEKAGVEVGVD